VSIILRRSLNRLSIERYPRGASFRGRSI